jgi:hypothetical protein
MQDLRRLGIPLVPATVIGERFVHGWNPEGLARLVGVTYVPGTRLTPEELARRLDRILDAAQRAVRDLPPGGLDAKAPDRDRTARQLAFHVFRLSAAFVDAREQARFPESWLQELAPPVMRDGEDLVRYGDGVRARIAAWCRREGWCDGDVDTYYGRQSAHELLERTTWHAAQHVRQLHWFLERLGVTPIAPLGRDDLGGLPMPRDVWS